MIKTFSELLILWSLLYNLSAAQWSWNSTGPYRPATKPGSQQVFNITSGFRYVDPFIGSAGGMEDAGHVFPGATLPFGMVKAVADTLSRDNHGGYAVDDSAIYGFSHMHDSGMDSAMCCLGNKMANPRHRNWWCK
jgi:putative alpha-1,2-mannosidase